MGGLEAYILLRWTSSALIWGFTPWGDHQEGQEKRLPLLWVIQGTDVLLQKWLPTWEVKKE